MTDNEIRNAIAGCVNSTVKCNECVFIDELYDGSGLCMEFALKYALDLINCQKAEIERLNAMVAAAEDYLHPLPFKTAYDEEIQKAKSEAIREFAEKLIEETRTFSEYDEGGWECDVSAISAEEIDRIAKEMVGENNG